MSRKPPVSAAGAKAPFLRMVTDADMSGAAGSGPEEPAVIASHALTVIDPSGKTPSYALRIVSWPLANGHWSLGVLEEKWPNGKLYQGTPESFRLWQTPQEFKLRAMAEEQVKFWSVNKTPSLIRQQLLGHREFYEEAVPTPPLVADSAAGKPLPFVRPEITARKAPGMRPALVADS